jgi:protein-disulfide isomerase
MTPAIERAATATVVLAAVAVAVASIHREFSRPTSVDVPGRVGPPTYFAGWKELLAKGVFIGDTAAPVKVIEFGDFECPFCKRFQLGFAEARKKYGSAVALVFVHYPLPQHRFARPAARASECADRQGRFAEFQDAVYSKQDSLGLKTWLSFGRAAGVKNTAEFVRCASDTVTIARIEAGIAAGNAITVRGTPTVIINGWRFGIAPSESLTDIVGRLIAGKPPLVGMEGTTTR